MATSPFDSLKPLAGKALEAALNRALALDPDTQDALKSLDGRRIALTLQAPALALQVTVSGQRLQVGPVEDATEPDLAVRTTLGGLLGQLPALMGSALRRDNAAPVGRVHVSGDAELARRLQTLAERFDPDWQQPFVAAFGEVIGVQVANAARGAVRQLRDAGGNLARNAAEFVTEESRDVVGRAELNAFHDDVDALRDDVERLQARIERLRGNEPAEPRPSGNGA
ncbi:SCP2 domain-containing protein [Pseudoxanthomonas yeongjuensis]|uniref:ubiquinone biosynthesis accessory factor UbiJ n=1 Tax=Pseudoxanthomonas yeongjuensis TaxID=377616 RepID=UPI001391BF9E|nr:SCP2 sterol-binding domain-containing protein [Pseudoxanthomonas yeongjuensis]KAF1716737.1 SCP2 domain-containing protein [Pseudoxanthomonas yeongjuensis]